MTIKIPPQIKKNHKPVDVFSSMLLITMVTGFTLISAWVIGFVLFLLTLPSLTIPMASVQADTAIVLTGGRNRIEAGLALLHQKQIETLFISGVFKTVSVKDITDKAPHLEIDSAHIILDKISLSTKGNAEESAKWLKKNPADSVLLITSDYHMRRALFEFKAILPPEIEIIPYPVFTDVIFKTMMQSAQERNLIIKEYNKYLFSLILRMI